MYLRIRYHPGASGAREGRHKTWTKGEQNQTVTAFLEKSRTFWLNRAYNLFFCIVFPKFYNWYVISLDCEIVTVSPFFAMWGKYNGRITRFMVWYFCNTMHAAKTFLSNLKIKYNNLHRSFVKPVGETKKIQVICLS